MRIKKLIISAVALVTALFLFAPAGSAEVGFIRVETKEVGQGRLAGLIIGIDPGHQAQGNNEREPVSPGSNETKAKVSSGTTGVNSKTAEHEINLQVSMLLRDAIMNEGGLVVMARESADVDISNIERAVMMNGAKADLVLRIHCNAADSSSPSGCALYVRKNGARAEECLAAAEALLPRMIEATGARDRGIVRNDTYTGLNWSEVPSILVEMGFLTNPAEDALLNDPAYQAKMVNGMVEGIADYFGQGDGRECSNLAPEAMPSDDAPLGE